MVTSGECQTPPSVKSVRLPRLSVLGGIAFENDPGPSVRDVNRRVERMNERPSLPLGAPPDARVAP
jgi:hypothetical protein